MKALILFLVLFISTYSGFAQDQEIFAKFIITDAKLNDVDVTKHYLQNKTYLVFYRLKDDTDVYLANVMSEANTQSFGRIFDFVGKQEEETDKQYRYERYTFRWSYINDYDDKKGTAKVVIEKVFKPAGIAFSCRIIPENLDVIELNGYMEGSLKELR